MRGEGPSKFTFQMTPDELEETKRRQRVLFHEIVEQCRREQPDMLVLDEALPACRLGLLPEDEFLSFLRARPDTLEIVLGPAATVRAPARPGRLRIGNLQAQASLRPGYCSPHRHRRITQRSVDHATYITSSTARSG